MMINERIREVRKHLSLTLTEFGSRIGVDGSSVSLWEAGRRNPSLASIKAIAREFMVSEEWLVTGKGSMMVPVDPAEVYGEKVGRLLALPDDDIRHQVMQEILDLPESSLPILFDFLKLLNRLPD